MTTDFTLYKLIILYMLNEVSFPLTNIQITDFILEKNYTNYFIVQQSIGELVDSDLINVQTIRNNSRYTINAEGRETLEFFEYKISDFIKDEIFEYLDKNKLELRDKNSYIANYYKSDNGVDYHVNLTIKENNFNIIDLNLLVPSEDIAISMCSNWETKNQDIYSYIFKSLM